MLNSRFYTFLSILLLLTPIEMVWGFNAVFVIDGSGSMTTGNGDQLTRQLILKRSKILIRDGWKVAIIETSEGCGNKAVLQTGFMTTEKEIKKAVGSLRFSGNNSFPNGYRIAQELLNKLQLPVSEGIILGIGDYDGLQKCDPNNINGVLYTDKSLRKASQIVYPFSYGGNNEQSNSDERKPWADMALGDSAKSVDSLQNNSSEIDKEMLLQVSQDINADRRRLEELRKSKIEKRAFALHKTFIDPVYLKTDGSKTTLKSEATCVKFKERLFLLKHDRDQSLRNHVDISYVVEAKKGSLPEVLSNKVCIRRCSTEKYVKLLRKEKVCGVNYWRLAGTEELYAIATLPSKLQKSSFLNIRKWPHISGSPSIDLKNQNVGVNFADRKIYDFRKSKPYSAYFVSSELKSETININNSWLNMLPSKSGMLQKKSIRSETRSISVAEQLKAKNAEKSCVKASQKIVDGVDCFNDGKLNVAKRIFDKALSGHSAIPSLDLNKILTVYTYLAVIAVESRKLIEADKLIRHIYFLDKNYNIDSYNWVQKQAHRSKFKSVKKIGVLNGALEFDDLSNMEFIRVSSCAGFPCLDGFWIGKTEVSHEAWKRIYSSHQIPNNKSNYPVRNISWNESTDFSKKTYKRLCSTKEWKDTFNLTKTTSSAVVGKVSSQPVSFTGDKGQTGVLNLIGNVSEYITNNNSPSYIGLFWSSTVNKKSLLKEARKEIRIFGKRKSYQIGLRLCH